MLPPVDFAPIEIGSKYDEKILTFCSYGAKEASEIAAFMGVKPSSYFRKNILAPLVEKDYLTETENRVPALYRTNPSIVEGAGDN